MSSSLPIPVYPGVTVTRNSFGWPVIDAPSIEKAYEALGYVQTFDRTWQMFDRIMSANG